MTHPDSYPTGNEYQYQPYYNNISSVLARFSPGTNDRLRVTIEHADGSQDSQVIQMDSTLSTLTLFIDDGGDCTHYTKGDTAIGTFSVTEDYLEGFQLSTSVGTHTATGSGLGQSGTS